MTIGDGIGMAAMFGFPTLGIVAWHWINMHYRVNATTGRPEKN